MALDVSYRENDGCDCCGNGNGGENKRSSLVGRVGLALPPMMAITTGGVSVVEYVVCVVVFGWICFVVDGGEDGSCLCCCCRCLRCWCSGRIQAV